MVDFFIISTRTKGKRDAVVEIYPKFILKNPSSDLMIRGGDFYAVWIEEKGLWSTSEQDVIDLVDRELDAYAHENQDKFEGRIKVLHMWDSESGTIDAWHKYCQKQMRDNFHMLDETLIFSNHKTVKEDYASKTLTYPLEEGDLSAYDHLMSVLYSPEERHKIEWAIGSIVSGDSKKIQKFLVLYGAAGTGKSTVLNIIQQLFEGYYSVFDAKALGSSSNAFALEAFKTNPLVAIQHDGDLSRIEDNTRLNSLVSHELMTVNEKFKSTYSNRFKSFLFMGTNKPVKITDAKSGLIRRLIDVKPSGKKLSVTDYNRTTKKISFELGAIAKNCLDVYMDDPAYYDNYKPTSMMGASNDFYNFVLDNSYIFEQDDETTLASAWAMYGEYCKDANVGYAMSKRVFKEELKNYFEEFHERYRSDDGTRIRNYYKGFKTKMFDEYKSDEKEEPPALYSIEFKKQKSIFDKECRDYPAQYATDSGKPMKAWKSVKTLLEALDTSLLHYVKVPINHIVIDFDLKGEDGKKSLELNLAEASKWPETYAELSKSGEGIHLHYIYSGDPMELQSEYAPGIEIKVFTGNSSLRRKLTKCNNKPIAIISSGLPLKGEKKSMINREVVRTERGLRKTIRMCLDKKIHGYTAPCVNMIEKALEDMYNSGVPYDVSDLYTIIWDFAASSSNQAKQCIKKVENMHFKSDIPAESTKSVSVSDEIIFFDIEVFPNLLLVNWKVEGEGKPVIRMINPSPKEIEELCKHKLVGFNCRRYDNHILYARLLGKNNAEIYRISQGIINGDKECFFGEAYNLSYTDIYDFSAEKKSLKKFEISLGITHKELGLPWDQAVPEDKWEEVAEYCDNDVIATEAVWNAKQGDFLAREILAAITGMTVNDTTNTLTTRFIFGNNRDPQNEFCYRNLAEPVYELDGYKVEEHSYPFTGGNMTDDSVYGYFAKEGVIPLYFERPEGESILPFFPGYKKELGKSTYRGEEVGEGGYVYAEPGIHGNVALLDIASMHPSSTIDECLFGPRYTRRFKDLRDARVYIKHGEFDKVREMFDGKLAPYLEDESKAKDLAQALKIAINSVYGLTSASFPNAFKDPRNFDNIVAKRGALFMVDLKHAVQEKGFRVAHIKTDSIKIPDATPEIIQFVMNFGWKYGYTFEHEATYDRMCLVNDAVYVAKYADADACEKQYGYIPEKNAKKGGKWTATGTQFQVPYVFKKLFSKEQIEFEDMCETKAVTSALYLDMNEPILMRFYADEAGNIDTYLPLEDSLRDFDEFKKALKKLMKKTAKIYKEEDLHDYRFIGKVGLFCPIKIGENGGLLVREKDGKYYSVSGSKGYRWVESWVIKESEAYDKIDRGYYDALVDDARETISKYGDFEWFVSDDPYVGPQYVDGVPDYNDPPIELPWVVGAV